MKSSPIPHLSDAHYQQLEESAISDEIKGLNFWSANWNQVQNFLLQGDNLDRINNGRVASYLLNSVKELGSGLVCMNGTDLATLEPSTLGVIKPDKPRNDEDGDPIKYETPRKTGIHVFALNPGIKIWELIGQAHNIDLPSGYNDLEDSEIGVEFWKWVDANPSIPIPITEGSKKAASLLSLGYAAIGLNGVSGGCQKIKDEFGEKIGLKLHPEVKALAVKGRKFYIVFDQDSKSRTVKAVNKQIKNLADKLTSAVKTHQDVVSINPKKQDDLVKIVTWHPGLGKGCDDLVAKLGAPTFHRVFNEAKTFDKWKTGLLGQLTCRVDLELNRRYLYDENNPIVIPSKAKLINIKAAKNTGKSTFISKLLAPVLQLGDKKILGLSHRKSLGKILAKLLGIDYVNDTENSKGKYLCVDSLLPDSQANFYPSDWENQIILIDEAKQLIWHLLSSDTCRKERLRILENLRLVLRLASKVFLLDADLDDKSIDFIKKLMEVDEDEIFTIVNQYKMQGKERKLLYQFGEKSPKKLISFLIKELKARKKLFLCVAGQKEETTWGSINIESLIKEAIPEIKKTIPDFKSIRIDSDTTRDPTHEAYGISESQEILEAELSKYQLAIVTPCFETGISIDFDYYDGVFGIFTGVQTADSVRQFLIRVRANIPRYTWIKTTGCNFIGNKTTTPESIYQNEKQQDKYNLARLKAFGHEEIEDGNYCNIALDTWAKFAAEINDCMWSYAAKIYQDLEEKDGYILRPVVNGKIDEFEIPTDDEANALEEEIKAIKDKNYGKHCEDVSQEKDISEMQYETLKKKEEKTKAEKLQLKKAAISHTLGIEVTPEIVEKFDDGIASKWQLDYFLTVGNEFLAEKDARTRKQELKNGDGKRFIPDSNRSQIGKKIDILKAVKLDEIRASETLHEGHPLIAELKEFCKLNAWNIKTLTNYDVCKIDSGIELAQLFLGMVGERLPFLGKKGARGQQVRMYGKSAPQFETFVNDKGKNEIKVVDGKAIALPDEREKVFKVWINRDLEAREKAEQDKIKARELEEIKQREAEELRIIKAEKQREKQRQWVNDHKLSFAQAMVDCLSHQDTVELLSNPHVNQDLIDASWEILTADQQYQFKLLCDNAKQLQAA